MKVKDKVILLLLSIVVMYLLLFIVLKSNFYQQKNIASSIYTNQNTTLFNTVFRLKQDALDKTVYDYTYWDEFYEFVNNVDKEWAQRNVLTVLTSFNIDYLSVYDVNKQKVFDASNSEKDKISINIPEKAFDIVEQNNNVFHFFLIEGKNLYEISGATIHKSEDTQRQKEHSGYFFLVNNWNNDFLNEFEKITGYKILVTDIESPLNINGTVIVMKFLNDYSGKPLKKMIVYNQKKIMSKLQQSFLNSIVYTIIISVIIFVIFVFAFKKWVMQPLDVVSKALLTSDKSLLINLHKKNDEFGMIAELIEIFFSHQQEILKFKTITDSATYGAVITDNEFNIIYTNQSFLNMIQYSENEILYKKIFDFYNLSSDLNTKEVVFTKKDTSTFTALVTTTIIKDKEGNNVYSSLTIIDITEKKKLEEQLLIRQKFDSLGAVASGIAHDFNNLLTGIMGYLDLLNINTNNLTAEQKEYILMALKTSKMASEVVNQVQSLSSKTISQKTKTDIYDIIQNVFAIVKQSEISIEKIIDFPQNTFFVNGVPHELNQVFLNLTTNAIHAIKKNKEKKANHIKVTAELLDFKEDNVLNLSEGKYVHLRFEDTGCGMNRYVKLKAFEPLFTTKDSSEFKGHGLGLAITYNIIVKNHKGFITIDSEENKGTSFHIYLPSENKSDENVNEKKEDKTETGIGKILIIEDEHTIRTVAKTILEKLGYSVFLTCDGEEGLLFYKKNFKEIDLVLLDLTMPKMSGQEVFEEMLKINPDVKVIISSGQIIEQENEELLSKAKGFLKKPYFIKELSQIIKNSLT